VDGTRAMMYVHTFGRREPVNRPTADKTRDRQEPRLVGVHQPLGSAPTSRVCRRPVLLYVATSIKRRCVRWSESANDQMPGWRVCGQQSAIKLFSPLPEKMRNSSMLHRG
jgi:hypothetical protein